MLNGMRSGAEGTALPADVNNGDAPVVVFDSWCPLCVWTVRFVLRRDHGRQFLFAALDSPAARRHLDHAHIDPESIRSILGGSTVALVHRGRVFTRSEAVIRIAAELPFPFKAAALLRAVPRIVRDGVYSAVANRRHKVWGTLDSCFVPEPADRGRFLSS
ncbi:MAG: DUF393 domain-containing protein [Gemmatimonadetes bacterium]|nr:DUF393 domain-containing protein [Gemmatimonadota bacterium]